MVHTCCIPLSILVYKRATKLWKIAFHINKDITDKAECHMIAAIWENVFCCGIEKCAWRERDEEIQQAWNGICKKQVECDFELSNLSEVCFFFSVISTSKLQSKKKKSRTSDEGQETEESNVRICDKSFQNFNAWKANFPSNFVLGWLAKLTMVQL